MLTLDLCGHLFGDELDAVGERLDAVRGAADFSRTNRGLKVVELRGSDTAQAV